MGWLWPGRWTRGSCASSPVRTTQDHAHSSPEVLKARGQKLQGFWRPRLRTHPLSLLPQGLSKASEIRGLGGQALPLQGEMLRRTAAFAAHLCQLSGSKQGQDVPCVLGPALSGPRCDFQGAPGSSASMVPAVPEINKDREEKWCFLSMWV